MWYLDFFYFSRRVLQTDPVVVFVAAKEIGSDSLTSHCHL